MAFCKVARLVDVPTASGLCVRIDGIDVGLFRVDNAIHAMENRCPHAGHPLHEGRLEGSIIECAAHGWTYDVRTGFRPGNEDGFPIPCFAVRIHEGFVWVDLEAPANGPRARARTPGVGEDG